LRQSAVQHEAWGGAAIPAAVRIGSVLVKIGPAGWR